MATRHLSVALIVLLIGGFSSGCFLFGGGGKKDKAPRASRDSRDDDVIELTRPDPRDRSE